MPNQDTDAIIKQLQKRLDDLEDENARLQSEIDKLRKENKQLKERLEEQKKVIKALAGPNTPSSQIPPYLNREDLSNNRSQDKDDSSSEDTGTSDGTDQSSETTKEAKSQDGEDETEWKSKGRKKGHEGITHDITADREQDDYIDQCSNCFVVIPSEEQQHVSSYLVVDLPEKIKLDAVLHNVYRAKCKNCGTENSTSKEKSEYGIMGTVMGPKLSALISLIWYRGRVPQDGVGSIIEALTNVGFSPAAIGNCLQAVANTTEDAVEDIYQSLQQQNMVNIDETGYISAIESREVDWIWSLSTPDLVYYEFRASRSKAELQELWDLDPGGVIAIVDGWPAYNYFPRVQRCWAHLIRQSQDLANRRGGVAIALDNKLRALYQSMKKFRQNHPEMRDPIFWHDCQIELEEIINLAKTSDDGDILDFATTLTNAKDDLLTALKVPGIPFHNNLAERCLRPLVIHRKIRGFVASEKGKKTLANHATLFETWKLQDKNPYEELLEILPGAA